MNRPQPEEFNPFYAGYIERVGNDVLTELRQQSLEVPEFLSSIPKEKEDFAYADGKWTLKELLGHMIDTERIMAYRLLRVSRNDMTSLPGFEENLYVLNGNFKNREWKSLVEEFKAVRGSNLFLFDSLTDSQLTLTGDANGSPISVRALVFIIAGHLKHHLQIMKERYL